MSYSYGMFTAAGDRAVDRLFNKVTQSLPITTTDKQLYAVLTEGMREIAKKYGEVWDTDVRDQLISRLERATGRDLTIYF